MAEEIDFENGRISNFERHVTLTLTLDWATWHTVMHHSSTSTYCIYQSSFESEKLFVDERTDEPMYGRTDRHRDRLYWVDLKLCSNGKWPSSRRWRGDKTSGVRRASLSLTVLSGGGGGFDTRQLASGSRPVPPALYTNSPSPPGQDRQIDPIMPALSGCVNLTPWSG